MASISGSDLLRLLKFHWLPFIWSVLRLLVLIKTLHLPPLKRFGGPKWGFSPSAEVAIEYSSSQHLRLLGGVGFGARCSCRIGFRGCMEPVSLTIFMKLENILP